eukprot:CFRG3403T1
MSVNKSKHDKGYYSSPKEDNELDFGYYELKAFPSRQTHVNENIAVRLMKMRHVYDFFEHPSGPWSYFYVYSIMFLIICMTAYNWIETIPDTDLPDWPIGLSEFLFSLTMLVEYCLRLWSCEIRYTKDGKTSVWQYRLQYIFSFKMIALMIMIILSMVVLIVWLIRVVIKDLSSLWALTTIVRLLRLVFVFFALAPRPTAHDATLDTTVFAKTWRQYRIPLLATWLLSWLVVIVSGSILYYIERDDENSGFTSLPITLYWGTITWSSIGYGDIVPTTGWGYFTVSIMAYFCLAAYAVPIGVFSTAIAVNINNAQQYKEKRMEMRMVMVRQIQVWWRARSLQARSSASLKFCSMIMQASKSHIEFDEMDALFFRESLSNRAEAEDLDEELGKSHDSVVSGDDIEVIEEYNEKGAKNMKKGGLSGRQRLRSASNEAVGGSHGSLQNIRQMFHRSGRDKDYNRKNSTSPTTSSHSSGYKGRQQRHSLQLNEGISEGAGVWYEGLAKPRNCKIMERTDVAHRVELNPLNSSGHSSDIAFGRSKDEVAVQQDQRQHCETASDTSNSVATKCEVFLDVAEVNDAMGSSADSSVQRSSLLNSTNQSLSEWRRNYSCQDTQTDNTDSLRSVSLDMQNIKTLKHDSTSKDKGITDVSPEKDQSNADTEPSPTTKCEHNANRTGPHRKSEGGVQNIVRGNTARSSIANEQRVGVCTSGYGFDARGNRARDNKTKKNEIGAVPVPEANQSAEYVYVPPTPEEIILLLFVYRLHARSLSQNLRRIAAPDLSVNDVFYFMENESLDKANRIQELARRIKLMINSLHGEHQTELDKKLEKITKTQETMMTHLDKLTQAFEKLSNERQSKA